MRYSKHIGVIAAVVMVLSCFLPWAYYPDLGKNFSGFFSEGNAYGEPGWFFGLLGLLAVSFFLIPKIWAKRCNMLVAALTIAYGVKTYVQFTSCYRGICPVKKEGIYLLLASAAIMLFAAMLPDLRLKE